MNWIEKNINFFILSHHITAPSLQFWQTWVFWDPHNFHRNLDRRNTLHPYHGQMGSGIPIQVNDPFWTRICSANIAKPTWLCYLGIYITTALSFKFHREILVDFSLSTKATLMLFFSKFSITEGPTAAFFFKKIHLNFLKKRLP